MKKYYYQDRFSVIPVLVWQYLTTFEGEIMSTSGNLKKYLFTLPDWEDRNMSQGWIVRTFLPPRFTRRSDDTYILYQCAKLGVFVTLFLLFLNFISLISNINFDFYLFKVDLQDMFFIEEFAKNFPLYTSTIIVLSVLPFYMVKYFYNINPRKVDVTWWYSYIWPGAKEQKKVMIKRGLKLIIVPLLAMYLGSFLPLWILEYYPSLHSSYVFYAAINIIYLILYSSVFYVIFGAAVTYRYMGSGAIILNNNSIYKGEQK